MAEEARRPDLLHPPRRWLSAEEEAQAIGMSTSSCAIESSAAISGARVDVRAAVIYRIRADDLVASSALIAEPLTRASSAGSIRRRILVATDREDAQIARLCCDAWSSKCPSCPDRHRCRL